MSWRVGIERTREIVSAACFLDRGEQRVEEGSIFADTGYVGELAAGGADGADDGALLSGRQCCEHREETQSKYLPRR